MHISILKLNRITMYSFGEKMVSYFEGLWITLGTIMVGKLFWMVYYEWRYSAGEEYLRYGKKFIKNKYMQ